MPGAHTRLPARANFATLAGVAAQHVSLFVVNARALFHTKGAYLGPVDELAASGPASPARSTTFLMRLVFIYPIIAFHSSRQGGPPQNLQGRGAAMPLEWELVFSRRLFPQALFDRLGSPVAQNDHLVGNQFGAKVLFAFRVFPAARLKPSLDID